MSARPITPPAPTPAAATPLRSSVMAALATVDDPEYPGVSIVALGLVETVDATADGQVTIGLVPTFSGCPALAMIATDVETAVGAVAGVTSLAVTWLASPVWTTDRISDEAKDVLASSFTVAVEIQGTPGAAANAATPDVECPRCGGSTVETSAFGPSRCRAVHRCADCGETIEVMRA